MLFLFLLFLFLTFIIYNIDGYHHHHLPRRPSLIARRPPPITIAHRPPLPVAATPMAAVGLEMAIAARRGGHFPAPPTTMPKHATPQLPPIPRGPSPVP